MVLKKWNTFGTVFLGRSRTTFSNVPLLRSGNFSAGTTEKVVFHVLSNRIFRIFFFVNGRQPGTTKRTKFSQYWSSALAWTSVILAGKRNGRRHSTMGLSKNVAVSEISYQMLEVLSFCNLPSSKNNCANYSGEKSTMRLSGVYFLRIRVKKKSNLVLLVVLVIESKL